MVAAVFYYTVCLLLCRQVFADVVFGADGYDGEINVVIPGCAVASAFGKHDTVYGVTGHSGEAVELLPGMEDTVYGFCSVVGVAVVA